MKAGFVMMRLMVQCSF